MIPPSDDPWRRHAACRGMGINNADHHPFYRGRGGGDPYVEAKAVCARCTVIDECLADCVESEESDRGKVFGYRAGMLPRARVEHIRRNRTPEQTRRLIELNGKVQLDNLDDIEITEIGRLSRLDYTVEEIAERFRVRQYTVLAILDHYV